MARQSFGPMHGERIARHQDVVPGTRNEVIISTYEVLDDGCLHIEFMDKEYLGNMIIATLDASQAAWLRDALDEYVQAETNA